LLWFFFKLVSNDLPRERLREPTIDKPVQDGDRWFDISDTSVREIECKDVLAKKAYLLFYERLS